MVHPSLSRPGPSTPPIIHLWPVRSKGSPPAQDDHSPGCHGSPSERWQTPGQEVGRSRLSGAYTEGGHQQEGQVLDLEDAAHTCTRQEQRDNGKCRAGLGTPRAAQVTRVVLLAPAWALTSPGCQGGGPLAASAGQRAAAPRKRDYASGLPLPSSNLATPTTQRCPSLTEAHFLSHQGVQSNCWLTWLVAHGPSVSVWL